MLVCVCVCEYVSPSTAFIRDNVMPMATLRGILYITKPLAMCGY